MSRPDLAEIVAAVLAELDHTPATGLTRGPGGRPEVPMRRSPNGARAPGAAAANATVTAGEVNAAPGGAGQRSPLADSGGQATPPVTVAEATACSPRPRSERDLASSAGDADAGSRTEAARSRTPRRPATAPAGTGATAAGHPEMVERIVADLRRRLDDPAPARPRTGGPARD